MDNKYAREQRINRNLTFVIVALVLLLFVFIYVIVSLVNRELTVEILPDISSVQMVKTGETQSHNVYGLAVSVFSGLNTWESDGEIDYINKIKKYRSFIDEDFASWLINDYNYKKNGANINELESRTKKIIISDQFYKPEYVKDIGNGTFEVSLHLEVQEKIDQLIVKHYKGLFKIYVAKQNAPKKINPWQLRIVGIPLEIKRLEDLK